MRFWNGVIMYAPRTPDCYAIPGAEQCVFRLMHKHGDVQAWNLYWLSKPGVDLVPDQPESWHEVYAPFSMDEVRAFYDALDANVLNHLSLATIVAQPPREAMRLLRQANLQKTRFYQMFGGEQWRETMLGRLFLADRLNEARRQATQVAEVIDFRSEQRRREQSEPLITKRPA